MGQRAATLLLTASWPRLVLGLTLTLGACKPGIGDACTVSTDCSQTADRICDTSQPGGYCTIYNCEPAGTNAASKCPDDAACIAFGAEPSPKDGCQTALGSTPYQRTFCLKKCGNNNDCRDGYECVDPQDPNRHPDVVDVDGRTKVCVVAVPPPKVASSTSTEVCTASSNPPDAGSSAGGAGPEAEGQSGGGGAGSH
jgi:hypothetical protein